MQPVDEPLPSGPGFVSTISRRVGFFVHFGIHLFVCVVFFLEVPSGRPTIATQHFQSYEPVSDGISSLIYSTRRITSIAFVGHLGVVQVPWTSSFRVFVEPFVPFGSRRDASFFHDSLSFVRRPRVVHVAINAAIFRGHRRRG